MGRGGGGGRGSSECQREAGIAGDGDKERKAGRAGDVRGKKEEEQLLRGSRAR